MEVGQCDGQIREVRITVESRVDGGGAIDDLQIRHVRVVLDGLDPGHFGRG